MTDTPRTDLQEVLDGAGAYRRYIDQTDSVEGALTVEQLAALERVHWPSGRQLLASCVFLAREIIRLRARVDALEAR